MGVEFFMKINIHIFDRQIRVYRFLFLGAGAPTARFKVCYQTTTGRRDADPYELSVRQIQICGKKIAGFKTPLCRLFHTNYFIRIIIDLKEMMRLQNK